MKMLERIGALCAALCLFVGSALAGVPGLDNATAAYFDVADDMRFTLSAQFSELYPYGEETVDMLNRALGHMAVSATATQSGNDMALQVDGESVMTLSERTTGGGTALTTSLLPKRTLVSGDSALDAFSGLAGAAEPSFDAFTAFADAERSYQALTDAIAPYAEEKKANYKIKGVGASKWSRIARLTTEQSTELAPLITAVLGSGMDAAYRERLGQLAFGKGFIVALYQTEEGGEDIAVYMKGNVSFPEGGTATLSYQWAFANSDDKRIDTYKFSLGKSKAIGTSREITASYTRKTGRDSVELSGKSSARVAVEKDRVTTTVTHELKGREENGARTLTGKVTTAQAGTSTTTTTVKPELTLTTIEGSAVLSGTVELAQKQGKKQATGVTLTFAEELADAFVAAADDGGLYTVTEPEIDMPQSSLDQNVEADEPAAEYRVGQAPIGLNDYTPPAAPQIVDLDTLTQERREALLGEAAQNLAGKLLVALAQLPAEDIALLSDNMSEADFAAFLEMVKGL